MSFSPGSIKQAQDFMFNRKVNKDPHLPLPFDNNIVYQAMSQKQLGVMLGNCLSIEDHLKQAFVKINKTIGHLCKLQCLIPRCYIKLLSDLILIMVTL